MGVLHYYIRVHINSALSVGWLLKLDKYTMAKLPLHSRPSSECKTWPVFSQRWCRPRFSTRGCIRWRTAEAIVKHFVGFQSSFCTQIYLNVKTMPATLTFRYIIRCVTLTKARDHRAPRWPGYVLMMMTLAKYWRFSKWRFNNDGVNWPANYKASIFIICRSIQSMAVLSPSTTYFFGLPNLPRNCWPCYFRLCYARASFLKMHCKISPRLELAKRSRPKSG